MYTYIQCTHLCRAVSVALSRPCGQALLADVASLDTVFPDNPAVLCHAMIPAFNFATST